MIIYTKDSIIQCTNCYKPLYVLTVDNKEGNIVSSDHVKEIPPQRKAMPGEKCICDHCNDNFGFTSIKKVGD